MPDPINSFSQLQKSFTQLQRAQGALSNGDSQAALSSLQGMLNPTQGSSGTPSLQSLSENPALQGLLNDPKIQDALGALQKGSAAPVMAARAAEAAGNRTLTEDSALASTELGLAPLSGGSVAPAFGEVIQGFIKHVNSSQQESEKLVESLALGEEVDVHQVMLALNEASNAMALTLQVRSHALKAYQDLMQIPL